MKRHILLLASIVLASLLYGQKINVDYDLNNDDIKEMLSVMGIECFKFELPEDLQNRKLKVIVKEYHNGELIEVKDTTHIEDVYEDQASIKAIMCKKTDSTESILLRVPPNAMHYDFSLKYDRDMYGWADLIDEGKDFETNAEIPFLTYTYAPTTADNPNYQVFCVLSQVATEYEKWHDLLNVKHFFVVILKFEDTLKE